MEQKVEVDLRKVIRKIRKLPFFIVDKLGHWVDANEELGVHEVRKRKGYHDEPLKGKRKGQRSVRLNRSWRIIYSEKKEENLVKIIVEDINKHDY